MFFLQRLIPSSRLNAKSMKYAQVVILLFQALQAMPKGKKIMGAINKT